MKKAGLILAGILVVGLSISVGAATGVKVSAELKKQVISVNGKQETKDVIVYDNTTYVPLREVGDMLGKGVDYKDGIIYIGDAKEAAEEDTKKEDTKKEDAKKEDTKQEEVKADKAEEGWVEVETTDENTSAVENKALNATCYITTDDPTELSPKEYLDDIMGQKEELKKAGYIINKGSIEKVADKEIVYFESVQDDQKQLEAYIIGADKSVTCFYIRKDDNSDPLSLKDELLTLVEAYLS